jgi:hypothetical protein
VKRDLWFRLAPYWLLATAIAFALLARLAGLAHSVSMALFLCVTIGFLALISGCRRATRFQASLPISGRQLLTARLLTLLGMLWLPMLVSVGMLLAVGGAARPAAFAGLAKTVAACTLAIVALQSVRIEEIEAPKWVPSVVFASLWFGGAAGTLAQFPLLGVLFGAPLAISTLSRIGRTREAGHPVLLVFAMSFPVLPVCAVLTAALLFRIWRVVPQSFQLAPAVLVDEAAPTRNAVELARAGTGVAPARAWRPVAQSVLSPAFLYLLPILFVGALSPGWIFSFCFLILIWGMARQGTRWLEAYPVHPRIVTIAILAPILLVEAAGYYAGFHLPMGRHPLAATPELRVQVFDLAAMAAWTLAILLFYELGLWRRLRRIPSRVRATMFGAGMLIAIVGSLLLLVRPKEPTLVQDAIGHLARTLPGGLPAVLAAAALVLGAMWLALDKLCKETEYAEKPRAPQNEF